MSEGCTHDCENCASKCSDKKSLKEELNAASSVKKVYAVMSGKGGVGKSLVTSMLAVTAQRRGFKTAVLDADITGPSIPTAFNIHERANTNMYGIIPAVSKTGIEIMSLNLLLENETDPVVWRGPVIAGAVKQFWTDVAWNDVDRYAAGNGRRAADGVPVDKGGRNNHSHITAGIGFHDSRESGAYGGYDESTGAWNSGEYVIF